MTGNRAEPQGSARRWRRSLVLVAAVAALIIAPSRAAGPGARVNAPPPSATTATLQQYGALPVSFIENHGQFEADAPYYAINDLGAVYFTNEGLRIRPRAAGAGDELRVTFGGARRDVTIGSLGHAEGVFNYYGGASAANWIEGVPTHIGLNYAFAWPGVDVRYEGTNGQIESTYVVAPGADPGIIELHYAGQDALSIDDAGNLALSLPRITIRETTPVLFQEIDGSRRRVAGGFALRDADTVSFDVGPYDRTRPLYIDPTLTYSTYLGGSGSDQANAVAVDASGNAYIAGFTDSPTGPLGTNHGGRDAFVTKLNPAGSAVVYSTFIGGTQIDEASGIAVDAGLNAYVAGDTTSTDFPTASPSQAANGGLTDAVIFKLGTTGTLVYSTYLGGGDDDRARSIAIDGSGNAYVAGKTISANFPAFPAGTAFDAILDGIGDAFVAKINTGAASGASPVYSAYLGGGGDEDATGIAVDGAGEAFLTGWTNSSATLAPAFPTAGTPLQSAFGGGSRDAFALKLTAAGTSLAYSTYLGGSGADQGTSIALEPGATPAATIAGLANAGFPTTAGSYRTTNAGSDDAFVAKVNATGSALAYATFVGGSGGDAAAALALDSSGNAQITGSTFSANFPVVGAFQAALGGAADAFATKVNPSGSALVYSTYLGGMSSDRGWGIANAPSGHAIVVGSTLSSTTFPKVASYQSAFGGLADAFAANIDGAMAPPVSVGGIAVMPDVASVAHDDRGSGSGHVGLALLGLTLAGLVAGRVAKLKLHRSRR